MTTTSLSLLSLLLAITLVIGWESREKDVSRKILSNSREIRKETTASDDKEVGLSENAREPSISPADHYATKADQIITQRMRDAIARDPTLSPFGNQIGINTTEGNIDLRGVVPTRNDKAQLVLTAQEIGGVRHVSNELVVQNEHLQQPYQQ